MKKLKVFSRLVLQSETWRISPAILPALEMLQMKCFTRAEETAAEVEILFNGIIPQVTELSLLVMNLSFILDTKYILPNVRRCPISSVEPRHNGELGVHGQLCRKEHEMEELIRFFLIVAWMGQTRAIGDSFGA